MRHEKIIAEEVFKEFKRQSKLKIEEVLQINSISKEITDTREFNFIAGKDNILHGKKAEYVEITSDRDCSIKIDNGDGFKEYIHGIKTDVPLKIRSKRGIKRLQLTPTNKTVTTVITIFACSNFEYIFGSGSPVVKIKTVPEYESFGLTTTGAIAEKVHEFTMTSCNKISIAPVDAECYIRFDADATTNENESILLKIGQSYDDTGIKIRDYISVIKSGAANVHIYGVGWGEE